MINLPGMARRILLFSGLALAVVLLAIAAGAWWLLRTDGEPDFPARRGELATVTAEPVVAEAGGFVSQAVRLRSDTGLEVDLRVLRPAEPGTRAVLVLLGGHRTGRDAVRLLGAPGNVAVVALDYPYAGPERPRGWRQVWQAFRLARPALADTVPAILLATEWAARQPWADRDRMELLGVSLGVPFATAAGALEPRFDRLWLIQGGATLEDWLAHNLERRIASPTGRRLAARLLHRLAAGPHYEPERWLAQVAPRPVVVIGARQDRRLPAPLLERMHAAAGEPRELLWLDGDHIDRNPAAVREILALVLARVEAPGAPAASP